MDCTGKDLSLSWRDLNLYSVKSVYNLTLSLGLFCFSAPSLYAQCGSGTCPGGAITTLPAGGTIAAGTTYCISGTVSNSTAYTVDGTLIIQSGTVSIGSLTVDKTGSVIVNSGAHLNTGAFVGQNVAPASLISNVTVCNSGYMSMTGTINQGEINFTVSDYGTLLADGSWSSAASDTYFKIGMGSLIEMCVSFTISTNGFFTETSSSPSYLVTRGAVTENVINGWLSSKQNSSLIHWSALAGPPAFLQYNSSNTCFSTACEPPGTTDNGTCGSVATSYATVVLPLNFLDVAARPAGSSLVISADLPEQAPANQRILESSADGVSYAPTTWQPEASSNGDGLTRYLFTLPGADEKYYHRIHMVNASLSVYSGVMPPISGYVASTAVLVYPDPATNFIYLSNLSGAKYTLATVLNSTGELVQLVPLPANTLLVRVDLAASLPTGIYYVRFSGAGVQPLIARVLKTP